MRSSAFYWKCDCPGSADTKKETYFSDKHSSESNTTAREIIHDFLGRTPVEFSCLHVAGNHFTYRFSDSGRSYLLRTDDGLTDDDYMAAESAVMSLLSRSGLPVPDVFETNTERTEYPVRFQIMPFVEYATLQSLSRAGGLDTVAIARQFGEFLAELHAFQMPGFGFIDTQKLRLNGEVQGRDSTWEGYFTKCLDRHLAYVRDHELLAPVDVRRIENIFAGHQEFLDTQKGSLLHRDFAFWNILGTSNEIKAVIDWDDAVIGDPADDLGVVNCFNDNEFMENLLTAYNTKRLMDGTFRARIQFYTLRNMLWKAMIRHYMGYFDQGDKFFLNGNTAGQSLREYTISKLLESIEYLEKL